MDKLIVLLFCLVAGVTTTSNGQSNIGGSTNTAILKSHIAPPKPDIAPLHPSIQQVNVAKPNLSSQHENSKPQLVQVPPAPDMKVYPPKPVLPKPMVPEPKPTLNTAK